jgi:hypothetical protein
MSVEVELCGIERRGKPRTLGARVQNISPRPISSMSVRLEWENEQPQPPAAMTRTAGGGTSLHSTTRFVGVLLPGERHIFYLDENYLRQELLGRVASLSPERYWIAVMSGEQELARVPGNLIGGVLDGLGV